MEFSGNTSGAIQATWLNVATGLWDSMIIYRDSTNLRRARYPGGTFFNPVGNTNISNAYVVGTGPVAGGTGFIGIWYSSRRPSGNYYSVNASLDGNKTTGIGGVFGNVKSSNGGNGFLNNDIQQVGNTIMVGGPLGDTTKSVNSFFNLVKGGVIGKSTGSGFVWSRDTIVPNFYYSANLGYLNTQECVRLAFSPNGQIGYAMFLGRLATSFGNNADSTLSPIVYKTTNGGTTWSSSPILPGFDWTVGHPEVLKNTGTIPRPYSRNQYKLYLNHGIDLAVDSVGTLHIVAVVTNPFLGSTRSIDSLNFGFTYNWDYKKYHPIIWDFMTDGTTWNTMMIDSIMTSELGSDPVDTTSNSNPWALAYGARIQVSRSVTGGKIFYSWTDSDTSVTRLLYNVAPDIKMQSYNISTQMVTPTINITSGNGRCYFHYLSDVSYYDNIQSGWICPLVYTTDRNSILPPYSAANKVNYNYLNCAVFRNSQYTNFAFIYKTQGVGITNHTSLINSIAQNYPNPFSQTTNIVVNIKQAKPVDLKVYDVLGNLIYTKTKNGLTGENTFVFDGSSLQAGVYYYTIIVDGERATKKMILQK